jgi:hypothetical protein
MFNPINAECGIDNSYLLFGLDDSIRVAMHITSGVAAACGRASGRNGVRHGDAVADAGRPQKYAM